MSVGGWGKGACNAPVQGDIVVKLYLDGVLQSFATNAVTQE
jgi:hypothetical protein